MEKNKRAFKFHTKVIHWIRYNTEYRRDTTIGIIFTIYVTLRINLRSTTMELKRTLLKK